MASITRRPPLSGSRLLSRILDTPALVSAVRALPAPALASLVHHVGLEDAGELVSLASSDQLQQLSTTTCGWVTRRKPRNASIPNALPCGST